MIVSESGLFRERMSMSKNVDMGVAGSLTVALLIVAVAFLLRSFYKRYTRMEKRKEDESK
jgi:hypothetical protein